jgi:SAM-dependent methyltransferase
MPMTPSDPKNYWENIYPDYWEKRVAEANVGDTTDASQQVENDGKTVSDESVEGLVGMLAVDDSQAVLDLGCGFGRAFPALLSSGARITGVDVSRRMLDLMPKVLREHPQVCLEVALAEDLPFDDSAFDHVLAIGAFDCFDQERALREMVRVCKVGGGILISGKANNYYDEDAEAIVAERNARAKGHPNAFTDFDTMVRALDPGVTLVGARFFLRRADFARDVFTQNTPRKFYMFVACFVKEQDVLLSDLPKFSDLYSRTWSRVGHLYSE